MPLPLKSYRAPSLVALALLLSLCACGDTSESWKQVQEKGGDTWDALKTWSAEKSAEARSAFSKKMDDLKPQLAVARVAAKKAGAEASQELEAAVRGAEAGLEGLKSATADTWKDALAAFRAAWEVLQQKISEWTA